MAYTFVYHNQYSDIIRGYWEMPTPTENEDGSISLPASNFWWQGQKYPVEELPAGTWFPRDGDKVYIEFDPEDNTKMIYHIIQQDSVDDYTPLSGDKTSSPGAMIWVEGNNIHLIKHLGMQTS